LLKQITAKAPIDGRIKRVRLILFREMFVIATIKNKKYIRYAAATDRLVA
jgi:hypothetical protein